MLNRHGILVLLLFSLPAQGAEYLDAERVAPKTAIEDGSALEVEFDEAKEVRGAILSKLLFRKSQQSSFRKDATLKFNPRFYEFNRTDLQGNEGEYFTGGGSLEFHSGKWKDSLSLGLTYNYSTDIDTRKDEIPVGVLQPDGDSISVISEAYVRLDSRDKEVSAVLYRQSFNLPYVNRHDSRMVPNAFEAYRVDYSAGPVDLLGAYITKFKRRSSNDFTSMSKQAGSDQSNGVVATGLRAKFGGLDLGAVNYYNIDTLNVFYGELSLKQSLGNGIDYQLRTQVTDQRSVGDEDIGDFRTWHWGASALGSYKDIVLKLKYTATGSGAAISSPWGGRPHYNSMMIYHFDRAGERAWGVGLSYTLIRMKLPDVSVSINYTEGRDAHSGSGSKLDDEKEFNITVDYKPGASWMNGLWVRLRYAQAERGAEDRHDFRAIVKFPINLF